MIGIALGAQTPVNVIIQSWPMNWGITLVSVAKTSTATALAATIVIGNHIVFAIYRIGAGTNPGNWRHFCPRRTGIHRATTTGT